MTNPADTAPPTVSRLGVAPRFPKQANYLKTYQLGAWGGKWSTESIPELEAYGRGEAGFTLCHGGKVTVQFVAASSNLHQCAKALQWHAVQAALGNQKPQARGPAKPVTEAATRREFAKLIKNGRHVHLSIWPPGVERYFDPAAPHYSAEFAAEMDALVSKGEFAIVRHLLLEGHAPRALETALLDFGPGLVHRKGQGVQDYASQTLERASNDKQFKTWLAERKAEQDNAQAAADSNTEWLEFWRRSVAYNYWSVRMARRTGGRIYWMFGVVNTAAHCLVLGWTDYALTLFHQYVAGQGRAGFSDYDDKKKPLFQRRTQFFLLRLIADWQGIAPPPMPRQADDEPLFTALLAHWRSPGPDALTPLLLAACDRHTHLAQISKDSADFGTSGDLVYIPFEILAVLRLRQMHGLPNPHLDHPLMATRMGVLPPVSEPYGDALLDAVVAQARKEFVEL